MRRIARGSAFFFLIFFSLPTLLFPLSLRTRAAGAALRAAPASQLLYQGHCFTRAGLLAVSQLLETVYHVYQRAIATTLGRT